MISMIVAMDRNRTIGYKNKLPWRLPADLAYFKKVTMGHMVVMGRKTYESIGKPLPGRRNVVLTRDRNYKAEGCTVCHSTDEVLNLMPDEEIFVIGGAEIFNEFFSHADRLYITSIDEVFPGDTFFIETDDSWKLVSSEKGEKNEKNPYNYFFNIYIKSNNF